MVRKLAPEFFESLFSASEKSSPTHAVGIEFDLHGNNVKRAKLMAALRLTSLKAHPNV